MVAHPTYLDYAATTPVRPEVLDAMLPFLGDEAFGNPSSSHQLGRQARAAVEEARRHVAAAFGRQPREVYFTAGGTEADNLAVVGGALAARRRGGPFRVAVSAVEHKAVLAAAHAVEGMGGETITLPVDDCGQLPLDALDAALATGVAVVSVMWVNNETGVIQNVEAIAARCADAHAVFHTDAVQAMGKIPVHEAALGDAMLSVSSHKIGGPKGVGAILLPDPGLVEPLTHGGGQQGGVRPGTENVPGIVGFGRAAELATAETPEAAAHTAQLRDTLEARLRDTVPDIQVNPSRGPRAPHVLNISVPGTDSEALLMHLDLAGICCSSGSACTTGAVEPSHVLSAMDVPHALATSTLRFSFAKRSTMADVDTVADTFPRVVEKVRGLRAVLGR